MEEDNHNEKLDRLKRELGALPYGSDAWRAKIEEIKAFNASDHLQSVPERKRQKTKAGRRRRNRRKTRRSRK